MSESIFEKRTLTDIHEEISKVYLSDNRPWIIGFSGGKDSTCLVQLAWHALSKLPKEKLQKKIVTNYKRKDEPCPCLKYQIVYLASWALMA